jgi:protein-S-isoprenylcysteine O-methyltransferase Ste14
MFMIRKLRIRIAQVFVILLFALLLVTSSVWELKAPFLSILFFLLGALLVGIASLGRLWCSLYIAGYKTKQLVTEGPYSMSRHPLHFFSLIGAVGVGLSSETLLAPIIILLACVIYYPSLIKTEEKKLKHLHGQRFEMYRAKVPCFFPKLRQLKEPKEYLVTPITFRRHIFSALWFIWFIGIVELIEELHQLKFLPAIFRIY